MSFFSNSYFSKKNILNFLFSFLPLSFIIGNLAINLNILFLIIFSFFFYGKKILILNYSFLDKVILFFFSLIIFICIVSNINTYFFFDNGIGDGFYNITVIKKSLHFLRFLILYYVIIYLIRENLINFKYFFTSCLFFTVFVSIDLFYQSLTGKDIFGLVSKEINRKLSGPFGDEYIAGGYLQRFSIFAFFAIFFLFNLKNKIQLFSLYSFLFVIFLSGMILAGNRMPLLLYFFSVSLIFLLEKRFRKYFLLFFLLFFLVFSSIYKLNSTVKNNYDNFHNRVSMMYGAVINKNFKDNNVPQHFREFGTFYNTWLMNKYLGGGLKSFRNNCHLRPNVDRNSKFVCNMHPHNYYLEILADLGLVGLATLFVIFFVTLYKFFILKHSQILEKKNYLILPFAVVFITEIFPLKSTGSFFTTGNATFIFLTLFVLIALMKKKS